MSINNSIIDALCILIDKEFRYAYRASNMLTLGFGEDVKHINAKGEERVVAKYGIHVQTAWRIKKSHEIYLGFGDFFLCQDGIDYNDYLKDSFGRSRFDRISNELNDFLAINPTYVKKILSSNYGDLEIEMTNELSLETLIDSSQNIEFWRFFEVNNSDHFVVFD